MPFDLQCYESFGDEGYNSGESQEAMEEVQSKSSPPQTDIHCNDRTKTTCKSMLDYNMVSDVRVLRNLLYLEDKYLPCSKYFELVQRGSIKEWMRRSVVDWMLGVSKN